MGVYGQAGTPITGSPPACRVFNSASISIAHNTTTALTFDSERFDTDAMHSTASLTGRITFNTAGLYLVTGHVGWATSASTATRLTSIRLNGSTTITEALHDNVNQGVAQSVTTLYKFAVNDYVELVVYQFTGGALNVSAVANWTPEFSAVWVGLGT